MTDDKAQINSTFGHQMKFLKNLILFSQENDDEIENDIKTAIDSVKNSNKEIAVPLVLMGGLVAFLTGKNTKKYFTEATKIMKDQSEYLPPEEIMADFNNLLINFTFNDYSRQFTAKK